MDVATRGTTRRADPVVGVGARAAQFRERVAAERADSAAPADVASALAAPGTARRRPSVAISVRPWQRRYVAGLVVADAVTAIAGSLAAAAVSGTIRPRHDLILTPPYVLAWVLALAVGRTYETRWLGVGSMEFVRVLRSGMAVFAIVAMAEILLGRHMGRAAVLAIVLTVALDLLGRVVLRRHLYRARWSGRCTDRVIAVGRAESVAHVVATLRLEAHHGLEVVGACLTDLGTDGPTPDEFEQTLGIAVLGGLADVPAAVVVTGSQVVAIAGGGDLAPGALRKMAWSLENLGTEVLVSPGLDEVAGPRLTVRPYPSLPLLHVEQPRLSGAARAVKAFGDRFAAGALVVVLSPVLLAVAVVVRASSPGPVFFKQTRIGLDGQPFRVWKFRSMVVDADDLLAGLDARGDKDGVLFKMRRDPRVTGVGAVLRRFSLDELPQLFNVVSGSMSLVGPRPPLPREVEQYALDVWRRLMVKPGITGLWQVSGRSDLSWEESVRLDLRYIENWSVGLDVSILWRTLHAVVGGRGAY